LDEGDDGFEIAPFGDDEVDMVDGD